MSHSPLKAIKIQEWDTKKLVRLKKDYVSAARKQKIGGPDRFVFDGEVLLIDFAKYLIEYLDGYFKGQRSIGKQ